MPKDSALAAESHAKVIEIRRLFMKKTVVGAASLVMALLLASCASSTAKQKIENVGGTTEVI